MGTRDRWIKHENLSEHKVVKRKCREDGLTCHGSFPAIPAAYDIKAKVLESTTLRSFCPRKNAPALAARSVGGPDCA